MITRLFLESDESLIELPTEVQSWVRRESPRIIDRIKRSRDSHNKPKSEQVDAIQSNGMNIPIAIIWDPKYPYFAHYESRTKDIGINGNRNFIVSEMEDLLTHELLHAFDPNGDDDVVAAGLDRNFSSQREIVAYTRSIINTLKRLIIDLKDEVWASRIKEFLDGGEFPYFAGMIAMNYKRFVDTLTNNQRETFKHRLMKYFGKELSYEHS